MCPSSGQSLQIRRFAGFGDKAGEQEIPASDLKRRVKDSFLKLAALFSKLRAPRQF
jgi:hypothetical protein